MKNSLKLLAVVFLSGCTSISPPKTLAEKNVEALKKLNVKINLLPIEWKTSKSHNFIECQKAHILTPDDTNFENYIQKNLESEIQSAGMLDPNGKSLKIVFTKIDIDINKHVGWIMDSEETFGKDDTVITRTFESSPLNNQDVCIQASDQFYDAVQSQLSTIIWNINSSIDLMMKELLETK